MTHRARPVDDVSGQVAGERAVPSVGVAYDEDLADRLRVRLASEPDLAESRMFGGLAFLLGGHMAITASGQGGALVRVDPDDSARLTASTNAQPAIMRGRPMAGWLRVGADDLRTDEQVAGWVDVARAYVRTLPPKRRASSP